MRGRDQPSSLDDPSLEDRFPIRFVALFCDRGCGSEVEGDIRAATAEQAYEGLRRIAVSERGWQVTDTEDICSRCAIAKPRTKLDNPPACGAAPNWPWGYLPCGCHNDGYGRHVR